jgi:ankyrin repeat protein
MHGRYGAALAVLAGVLLFAAPVLAAKLPSAADLERAPEACYVLAQFTPVFWNEKGETSAMIAPRGHPGAADHVLDTIWFTIPPERKSRRDSDGALYGYQTDRGPKVHVGLLFARLDPGAYTLSRLELHGYESESHGDRFYTTEHTFKPELSKDFVLEPGKITYVGSFAFNDEPGSTERLLASVDRLLAGAAPRPGKTYSVATVETMDNLPSLLEVLDAARPGLGTAVGRRVVRAEYLHAKRLQEKLRLAAGAGDADAVKALLDEGADPNMPGRFLYSVTGGRREIITLLLAGGYKVTCLLDAIAAGDVGAVESMVKADPGVAHVPAENGDTPLHVAAVLGDTRMAEVLLGAGASANARNNFQEIPLHDAVRGPKELVQLLVSGGSDVNASDGWSETPLHNAAYAGNLAAVEIMLSNGALVDARSKQGWAPLARACSVPRNANSDTISAKVAIVRLLIAKGADVNAPDKSGNTPLFAAAVSGARSLVDELIAHGADVNTRNAAGRTVLDQLQEASAEVRSAVEDALRRAGAK